MVHLLYKGKILIHKQHKLMCGLFMYFELTLLQFGNGHQLLLLSF